MRDSKSLIQQLNEFGITCSYDEVLQFKKSSAIAATEDIKLRAISDSKPSMIQTVVDNFDADISSQNGKLSTHSLAVLMTQTSKIETANETSGETIDRLSHLQMADSLDYEVEIEHYRGPKRPEMPAAEAKKSVPPLKVLVSMVISLNRAQETDFSFVQDILSSTQCPEYNGYNTRQCREAGQYTHMKTNADYLPLIDMTPSDPDTIMTALSKAKILTTEYGKNFTVFTAD